MSSRKRQVDRLHRFAVADVLKVMSHLTGFAQSSGVINPVGAAVRNSFASDFAAGHGEKFLPVLSDVIAELNGISLQRGTL